MRPQLEVGRAVVAEAWKWSLGQGSVAQLSCGLTERRTELLGFLPWRAGGDGRRCAAEVQARGRRWKVALFLGLLWYYLKFK